MATFRILVSFLIKSSTFWYIDRLPTSSYTGVIHFKNGPVFGPPCTVNGTSAVTYRVHYMAYHPNFLHFFFVCICIYLFVALLFMCLSCIVLFGLMTTRLNKYYYYSSILLLLLLLPSFINACQNWFLTIREAAWYIISAVSVSRPMSACLSVDNFWRPWRRKFIF